MHAHALAPTPPRPSPQEEQLAKKRRGVEDWKMGDGAAELQSAKPWYHYPTGTAPPKDNIGRPVPEEAALKRAHRDARCVCCAKEGGEGCAWGEGGGLLHLLALWDVVTLGRSGSGWGSMP